MCVIFFKPLFIAYISKLRSYRGFKSSIYQDRLGGPDLVGHLTAWLELLSEVGDLSEVGSWKGAREVYGAGEWRIIPGLASVVHRPMMIGLSPQDLGV